MIGEAERGGAAAVEGVSKLQGRNADWSGLWHDCLRGRLDAVHFVVIWADERGVLVPVVVHALRGCGGHMLGVNRC